MDKDTLAAEIGRPETVSQFWDRAHGGEDPYWLSGFSGPDIWRRLDVSGRIRRGAVVLNIGVGLGHCTRALAEAGCVVHALDISPIALERVRNIATGWLSTDLDRIPRRTFDVALSHLVAQHMTDADLSIQAEAVLRALKPRGIFAMQFLTMPGEETSLQDARNVKAGSVRRSPEDMAKLIKAAGGRVLRMFERDPWPTGEVWWVVQAERTRWWQLNCRQPSPPG